MPKTPKNIIELPRESELETATKAHAELYKKFLPTLEGYQDMAKQALDLQIKIFKLRFEHAIPGAQGAITERPLIASISARETPAKLEELLAALAEKQIEVAAINYDPRNFTYVLFGKSE